MTTTKLLKINLILLAFIIITIIAIVLFNNYIHVPYDPFNDPREYERLGGTKLADDEMPNGILEKANIIVSDYHELLDAKGINNITISGVINLLNTDGNYHTKYIVVDLKANKIIATICFRYSKDGTLKSLTAEYRNFNTDDFLTYVESLINIKSFNISNNDIESIKSKMKNSPTSSWNIGNKYRYEYYKQDQIEGVYGGIDDLKIFNITF